MERSEVTGSAGKIWEATREDVREGATVGPFFSKAEVDKFLGVKDWIPTQRFEVVQKNKVRGVDSATVNGINMATKIVEKPDLPSTDVNVAALRWMRSHCSEGQALLGWVLDERKAYRQIPIHPDHRRWSVISLRDPGSGKVAFFVMIGHSFGLVAAVYNYNRRSAAITDILRRLFQVAAFNFYDDKYGFETEATCRSAHQVAQRVHFWLGAKFDAKKLQLCSDPTILGVTYDLQAMCLRIKPSRKEELLDEIDSIVASGLLPPGQAGKLRGKLMFGASQLWGKIGRAFLRVLSERQSMYPSHYWYLLKLVKKWLPRKSQIAMIELLATVVALKTFAPRLRGSLALLFVDSEPVQGALVKGYPSKEDFCELIGVFWRCALDLGVNIYIDRVPTDSNPADPPSRSRMDIGIGWETIDPCFP